MFDSNDQRQNYGVALVSIDQTALMDATTWATGCVHRASVREWPILDKQTSNIGISLFKKPSR
jgi:hypothetical protein